MAIWDVFQSDRLEIKRGLSTAAVRDALARGVLRDDDLIRPAGTATPWARIVDMPPLDAPGPESSPEPAPESPVAVEGLAGSALDDLQGDPGGPDFEDLEPFDAIDDAPEPSEPGRIRTATFDDEGDDDLDLDLDHDVDLGAVAERASSSVELATWDDVLDAVEDDDDPQEEDEAAAEFTLARGSVETVEELDLAAMVDVAFQLVLFFLVTATTVMFKSLEVPRPNPETPPPAAAAQGPSRTLQDLKETNILVEIDPAGAVKIDGEPIPAEMPALIERLRALRERTSRKTMLLSADFTTPHRSAVLAYDAANEIGLGIAIARPRPARAPGAP